MRFSLLSGLIIGASLLLMARAADRPCIMSGFGLAPPTSCEKTNHWSRPMDLTGDGSPEFFYERWHVEKRVDGFDYKGEPWWLMQNDDFEAFYPEPHVELYALIGAYGVEPGATRLLTVGIEFGSEIVLDPPPVIPFTQSRQWFIPWRNQRQLAAEGLGIIYGTKTGGPARTCRTRPARFTAALAGWWTPTGLGTWFRNICSGFGCSSRTNTTWAGCGCGGSRAGRRAGPNWWSTRSTRIRRGRCGLGKRRGRRCPRSGPGTTSR